MNLLILIAALIHVESSGDPTKIGDNGNSWGPLQLSAKMSRDVNRISGKAYTREDAFDLGKSIEMALIYFRHYGDGKSIEDMSRMWVGGPDGWEQLEATESHWQKVKTEIIWLESVPMQTTLDRLYPES